MSVEVKQQSPETGSPIGSSKEVCSYFKFIKLTLVLKIPRNILM